MYIVLSREPADLGPAESRTTPYHILSCHTIPYGIRLLVARLAERVGRPNPNMIKDQYV